MPSGPRLGRHIRAYRQREGITQAALASRLGISPSYLNLLEHDRRPVSANLMVRLAQALDLDLRNLGGDHHLAADLSEVFGDQLFAGSSVGPEAVTDLVSSMPEVAESVRRLYHAYAASRETVSALSEQVLEQQDVHEPGLVLLPSEEVSDYLQRQGNHFPLLEDAAEQLRSDQRFSRQDLYGALTGYLSDHHKIHARIETVGRMQGAVRRYLPERRELWLSEVLRRGSRNFQVAHQIGLLELGEVLDRHVLDAAVTSDASKALCRVALANYFAAAVVLPYERFYESAETERYDLELLGHRFRASFEQICHRCTTLRRPGAAGVPFQMVRVDIAGNISKKFSATEIRLPRFSGLCPLWNVHQAFRQPGMIHRQLAVLPDGKGLFSVARTVERHPGRFHAPRVTHAIGLSCDLESADRLVYADGFDLANLDAATPVGITCRLCDRTDCQARAFPSLRSKMTIDETVRGVSFFAPVGSESDRPE